MSASATRPPRPLAVLFACGQNSVRSPIAAGLFAQMFGSSTYVSSAGVRKGELDPFAIAVMAELGLDISKHKPVTFEELVGRYASATAPVAGTVTAVKGDTSKKDAMRDEMRKVNFNSVRGSYKYGNNHIPIQNFYLQDVVKGEDKDFPLSLKTVSTIVKDSQDRFHDKCSMKW